jgi:hypothetical protein
MEKDEEKETQGKGFTIKDKRFSAPKEEEKKEAQAQKEEKKEEHFEETGSAGSDENIPLPEITFSNFLLSVSTSALIQLGVIQDPNMKEPAKHLPLAKQTIDLITMLREKTKGNLTSDEEKLIDTILYDLRLRYVKALG